MFVLKNAIKQKLAFRPGPESGLLIPRNKPGNMMRFHDVMTMLKSLQLLYCNVEKLRNWEVKAKYSFLMQRYVASCNPAYNMKIQISGTRRAFKIIIKKSIHSYSRQAACHQLQVLLVDVGIKVHPQ